MRVAGHGEGLPPVVQVEGVEVPLQEDGLPHEVPPVHALVRGGAQGNRGAHGVPRGVRPGPAVPPVVPQAPAVGREEGEVRGVQSGGGLPQGLHEPGARVPLAVPVPPLPGRAAAGELAWRHGEGGREQPPHLRELVCRYGLLGPSPRMHVCISLTCRHTSRACLPAAQRCLRIVQCPANRARLVKSLDSQGTSAWVGTKSL
mmetsp:Transcript_143805/g.400826  ORF Transcript_143805/g.400826 Transcript_143805/m.400826 type:complete len:202 (+) Transcript_143805:743-1348(+)